MAAENVCATELAKHVLPDEGLKKLPLHWNDGMGECGGAALTSTNKSLEDVRNDETKRNGQKYAYTSSRCCRLPLQRAAAQENNSATFLSS